MGEVHCCTLCYNIRNTCAHILSGKSNATMYLTLYFTGKDHCSTWCYRGKDLCRTLYFKVKDPCYILVLQLIKDDLKLQAQNISVILGDHDVSKEGETKTLVSAARVVHTHPGHINPI